MASTYLDLRAITSFEWRYDQVTTDRRRLLQRLAFSESRHFSWDMLPANTMAYDSVRSLHLWWELVS